MPKKVLEIVNILKDNGYEAFAVGGCIRDSLLNKEPNDWDICTSALPCETIRCFEGFKVLEKKGHEHGTITIVANDEQYEVTTYRVDGEYSDSRHPDEVQFVTNIDADLSRRDFTINAMAYNPSIGLIDCFNGQEDLKNKIIRCVGDADKRFNEDALRILRALRFASTLEFEIDEEVKKSIHKNKFILNGIAKERINVELCKLIVGKGVGNILNEFADVFAIFIPELIPMVGFSQNNPHHDLDVWGHTIKSITCAENDVIIRLALLLHDIGKPDCYCEDVNGIGHFYEHSSISADISYRIMKRLKFDSNTIDTVKTLVYYHGLEIIPSDRVTKRWLNKIGEDNLRKLFKIKRSDVLAQSQEYIDERLALLDEAERVLNRVIGQQQCFCLKDLAINGQDLINAGIEQGKQVGDMLNKLMDMVIDEQIKNDKVELLNALFEK